MVCEGTTTISETQFAASRSGRSVTSDVLKSDCCFSPWPLLTGTSRTWNKPGWRLYGPKEMGGCAGPLTSQASATISHKRRKPTSDHWQAIGPVFLWLTSYGSGSSGGILDWWDMQPLGGGIYWYGFCAGCWRAEGNGAALRVNYTQSHTQFTPTNLVRESACKAAHACCGVVCAYNLQTHACHIT